MAEEGEAREEVAAGATGAPEIDFSKKHPLEHTWRVPAAARGCAA
jgi:hypothetical protein